MSFNFEAAVNAAKAITDRADGNTPVNYKYPLVYPQSGQTMTIRPLFNPKSGQIIRLVNRHERVACYRTYGHTKDNCPICKIQQQVKDKTGTDPFGRTSASKARGICFAQFVSGTLPIEKGQNKGTVQPGEIILFMCPWSVYQAINTQITAIAQTPTGMDQAFCHADSGLFVQINVSNDFKYTTTSVPYMTFNPSGLTDDQFITMLENIDDLTEQVLPSTLTEEVEKQVKEYADNIYKQYFDTPTPDPVAVANTMPTNFVAAPAPNINIPYIEEEPAAPVAPANASAANTGKPACFGKNHDLANPQCICCPLEVQCADESVPF